MQRSFAEAVSWVPVSQTFSGTLGRAHQYAIAQSHGAVTLEHLLLALAEDPDASVVLQASNIDISRLMNDVSVHLGHHDDRTPPGHPVNPGADEALIRILDYAAAAARQSKRRDINGAIVLAAIVGEGRSIAASLLQSQGLTFEGAIKALQRAPAAPRPPQTTAPAAAPAPPPAAPVSPAATIAATPPAPAPASELAASINGSATQTNEQILANVRRRIDANRAAAKPAPVTPQREPYPQPPEPIQPIERRYEPAPLPPPPATAPAPVPPTYEPPRPMAAAPVMPAPLPEPQSLPAAAPEPIDQIDPGYLPADPAVAPLEQADPHYSAPYPEFEAAAVAAPMPPAADAYHDYVAPPEHAPLPPPQPEPMRPSRLPPPLPPPIPAAAAPMPSSRPAPIINEPPPSPLRPRQLGAPVVPPSSVAWPAPVQPQPAAFPAPAPPPASPAPMPQPAPARAAQTAPESFNSYEGSPYDGGIAGAPFPEPDSVPPRPVEQVPVAVRKRQPPRPQPAEGPAIEPGQLAENIPRSMRVGKTEIVEVRIARGSMRAVVEGMQGGGPSYLHDLVVTKAMSVRLRAMGHGFQIEAGSPETQWIDNDTSMMSDDFASWRWNITPLRRGPGKLQLIVSARTIASDGLAADTLLPDQVIDVAVKADYGRMAKKVAGWAGLMFLGGVLSRFGQGSLDTALALWRGFQ